MAMPLVTIAVAVYNTEPAELKAAVSSALAQTYESVEVVVVDDGSTRAETIASIDALTGVQVIRQENRGTGSALNTGIQAGIGKYVLALGSDDILDAGAVGAMLETLNSGQDVVISFPVVELFGTETGTLSVPDEMRLEDIALFNGIVASALIRRDHWEQGGRFDEHRDCSEDWVLWATLLGRTRGRAIKSHAAVLRYRRTGKTQNRVNRTPERVQNARRYIAENLPDRAGDLYLAAAALGGEAALERDSLRPAADRWAKVEPALSPLLPVRRLARKLWGAS